MTDRRTNLWAAVITALAALLGAAVGSTVTYLTQDRATDVRLLELGVQILQENPKGQNRALREWGLQLMERYSEEDLPPDLRESLRDSLSLPAAVQSIKSLSQIAEAMGPVSVDEQGRITAQGVGRGTVIVRSDESADTAVVDVLPLDSTDRGSSFR